MQIGTPWFTQEQWERFREVAEDPEIRGLSFERWRAQAEMAEEAFQSEGMNVRRDYVDVGELLAWCRSHGQRIDGEGLCAFVVGKDGRMPDNLHHVDFRIDPGL